MKRIISWLLATAMFLSLAACAKQPSGEETTANVPSDNETTVALDSETTAPNHSGGEVTSPDHGDDETNSPDHSGGEVTAPDHGDGETTSPDHSDGEVTAPPSSDNETTAPILPGEDAINPEIPDDFFVEDEDDYVSGSIIQSGNEQSSKDEDPNARLSQSGIGSDTKISEKTTDLPKKMAPANSLHNVVNTADTDIPSSSETDAMTEEASSSSSPEDSTADESESATEIATAQSETEDPDTNTEESTVAPDTTIKGYEYKLENCYVSGYIGNDLYIIQDFGSLAWNKKGIGHSDGTYIWSFDEDEGFFSISSMNENMIIVGNPTDENVESLWDDTSSYLFGYLIYDEETKTLTPLYETDNLRFYTATYFVDGFAIVSVEVEGEILFGVINTEGEYVIEPCYKMIHDETNNGIAISAKEMTLLDNMYDPFNSEAGRNIVYSNTLFTNVQHIRRFEYTSSTVGLIDVKTGEEILPCTYSYVEYLGKTEYFVIDPEGDAYLFDSSDRNLKNCENKYAYFAKGWTLTKSNDDTICLRDENGDLYPTTDLYCILEEFTGRNTLYDYFICQDSLIMTNILSSEREEQSQKYRTAPVESFNGAIEGDGSSYKIWNKAHDSYIDADSVAVGYGKLLFTKDNYVYRLDYDAFEYTRLEIGYGGFGDLSRFGAVGYSSFENVEFRTYINIMGEGIYNVRIEKSFSDGSSWFDIIINEYGEVILDVAVNSTYIFDTNYLGLYDKALYEIAGNTNMKDNYFVIRNDGHACLLQFVRKSVSDKEEPKDESSVIDHPERTISNDGSSVYISPFVFNFKDPSSIELTFEGNIVDAQNYYYDPSSQALKLHPHYLDKIFYEKVKLGAESFNFSVRSGDEVVTVTFIIKTYNFN